MQNRFPLVSLVVAAILGSSACLSDRSINDPRNGLPPDTLPLSVSDSTLSFSVETSALFSGDSIQVFFTIRNNAATTRQVQGSSSCALTVRAYTLTGAQVSPSPSRVCTTDLVTYATLTAGEVITISRKWAATSMGTSGGGATELPTGTYELEAYLDASNFQRTSRRLRVQVVKR